MSCYIRRTSELSIIILMLSVVAGCNKADNSSGGRFVKTTGVQLSVNESDFTELANSYRGFSGEGELVLFAKVAEAAIAEIAAESPPWDVVDWDTGNIPSEIYSNCIYLRTLSNDCLLYTSPSPRDQRGTRMPSSA